MSDKKVIHPNGEKLVFNEAEHSYKTKKKKYTSATQFLGQFFPKFEADRIAYFVARKRGITKEEVLQEWEDNKNAACDFGTAVHLHAELHIQGLELNEPNTDRERDIFPLVRKAVDDVLVDYDFVEAEKIVFSPKHGIAGTIDVVLRNKKTGKVCLLDYKTNKKIERENRHSKPAYPPIEDHNDANFTKYAFQLNLYKYIMETEGYCEKDEIDELILLHILADDTKEYKVPFIQEDVVSLLKYVAKKAKNSYNKEKGQEPL
jgi:hypothetical protein